MIKRLTAWITLCLTLFTLSPNSYAANESLKFGVGYFYPPFIYSGTHGEVYGFDVELVMALCKELNDTCTFSQDTLTENFKKMANRKLDGLIGAFSITNERKRQYDFAGPYFPDSMSYLSLANANIQIPADLAGKKIGVIQGSTFDIYLRQNFINNFRIQTYTTTEDLIAALSNKKVNIILLDTPVANYWIQNSGNQFSFAKGGYDLDIPFVQGYGIALQPGNPQRVAEFNQALIKLINNGTYDAIKKRYF